MDVVIINNMNEWKCPSILFWLLAGAQYCSNQCWAVLNPGYMPTYQPVINIFKSQIMVYNNHGLQKNNLKVSESWVLSWKSLVLWGFWNNPNWPFIYSQFVFQRMGTGSSLILQYLKNWNWWFFKNSKKTMVDTLVAP